jgi:hypothetical protein
MNNRVYFWKFYKGPGQPFGVGALVIGSVTGPFRSGLSPWCESVCNVPINRNHEHLHEKHVPYNRCSRGTAERLNNRCDTQRRTCPPSTTPGQ